MVRPGYHDGWGEVGRALPTRLENHVVQHSKAIAVSTAVGATVALISFQVLTARPAHPEPPVAHSSAAKTLPTPDPDPVRHYRSAATVVPKSAVAKPVVKAKPAPAKPKKKKTTAVTGPAPAGPWSAGAWGRFPASVERSARCVAKHESWHAGLWRAVYHGPVSSTASGFAQWLDSTWRTQAKRAGVGTQYRRAYQAPAAVQAAVFAFQAQHHGLYPWSGTNCPGT